MDARARVDQPPVVVVDGWRSIGTQGLCEQDTDLTTSARARGLANNALELTSGGWFVWWRALCARVIIESPLAAQRGVRRTS
jgi:hypothetical protein